MNKQCKRDGRHYRFDPFWAIKHGGESEREQGHTLLTGAMHTVLANHGIDPDTMLDSDQTDCLRLPANMPAGNPLAFAS